MKQGHALMCNASIFRSASMHNWMSIPVGQEAMGSSPLQTQDPRPAPILTPLKSWPPCTPLSAQHVSSLSSGMPSVIAVLWHTCQMVISADQAHLFGPAGTA
ncbi:hypothetical protein ABBQ32_006005 [Trebouxia sp. C0010 RCD-2024]